MYARESEAPHIELVKPDTGIDPVSTSKETLPDLVEYQDIPTIELEQDMGI